MQTASDYETGKGNPRRISWAQGRWSLHARREREAAPDGLRSCGNQPANTRLISRRLDLESLAHSSAEAGHRINATLRVTSSLAGFARRLGNHLFGPPAGGSPNPSLAATHTCPLGRKGDATLHRKSLDWSNHTRNAG